MSEKKVFISGSISVKTLNDQIKDSLQNIISKNYHILVGDAPGIDTLIQDYLLKNKYEKVTIYSISSFPRYSASNKFSTKYIEVSNEIKKERERQTFKDKRMSEDSDFSLVIWDGKSKGSFANILRAIESKKFVKIYYTINQNFIESSKITKEEIEYIYRTHNGYSASEVVEYLKENGYENFNNTQNFNKYLLEINVLKKEDKVYMPLKDFEDIIIVELYNGKPKGVKFKNEFITWIEKKLSSTPTQGELF